MICALLSLLLSISLNDGVTIGETIPTKEVSKNWHIPLDLPVSLSANFGELRGGHLHAGIDLRVFGQIGTKVYSISDGYICRASVSHTGYGNAVYVRHNNGYTSIYGHLDEFTPAVAKRVKEEQRRKESFVVTLEFEPHEFPVVEREFIGRAGNTGRSGGPHLHLEVRDENNVPLNIIERDFYQVKDTKPPIFQNVAFVAIDSSSGVWRTKTVANYNKPVKGVISLPQNFYLAIDAVDKQNDTPAKLAVDEYFVFLDDQQIFYYKNKEYNSLQSGSMISLIDYQEHIGNNRTMLKTLVEPLSFYQDRIDEVNGGVVSLKDDEVHTLKIVISDEHNNKAQREFRVKRSPEAIDFENSVDSTMIYIPWYAASIISKDGFQLIFPPASLYRSTYCEVTNLHKNQIANDSLPIFSQIWSVEPVERQAFNNRALISIKADMPEELMEKALIVSCSPRGGLSSVGGRWDNGALFSRVSSFGTFFVTIDTIPPVIRPHFDVKTARLNRDRLDFTISDELSGIHSYRAEIEGEWILAQYDEKFRRLSVSLRGQIKSSGKKRNLKLEVIDRKGNTTIFNYQLVW